MDSIHTLMLKVNDQCTDVFGRAIQVIIKYDST